MAHPRQHRSWSTPTEPMPPCCTARHRSTAPGEPGGAAHSGGDGGWSLVGKDSLDSSLARLISDAVHQKVLDANAQEAGTTSEALLAGSELNEKLLHGEAGDTALHTVAALIFSFMFYMSSIVFGLAIANSVLEEKQNRVVEILATVIPIRQLLYGKVLGNTVVALGQMAVFALVGLVGATITGKAARPGGIIGASGCLIVFFLAGFLILASAWAVVGSPASRSEDLRSSSTPIMMVIFAALFVGLFAKGGWLVVASYIPVVSSVAMPVRMLSGQLPLWAPAIALVLALAAAAALVVFGETVYRGAILQAGGALSLKKALKLESKAKRCPEVARGQVFLAQ